MSIDFPKLPIPGRSTSRRRNPLFDTGDRNGREEIRDGAKFLGEKIADGAKAAGRGLKKLVTRKQS